LLPYILFEKDMYILALGMASPENQHCANCISALSFPIQGAVRQKPVYLKRYNFANLWIRNILTRHEPELIKKTGQYKFIHTLLKLLERK